MKVVRSLKIHLEDFSNCFCVCNEDIPMGQIYDFSCALKSMLSKQIAENQAAEDAKKQEAQAQEKPQEQELKEV